MVDTVHVALPRPVAVPRRTLLPPWCRTAFRIGLSVLVTLFGLMALTFFIGRLLPLDPVIAILGDSASQEAYDAMYTKLGLDQPLWVQFASYMSAISCGWTWEWR